ncbi:hypothetical protein MBLNU13_g11445t1 [Cladosporium sp. NU13]
MASSPQDKKNPIPSTRDQSPPDSAYIGETATIEVGTGANIRTYYVGFAEANTGIIHLETEEPAVFGGFVKWLYTHKPHTDKFTKANYRESYMSIVKLWIFADRRKIPLLMNEMIDSLHQSMVELWLLPSDFIRETYDNTTEESALHRMLVDMYASVAGSNLSSDMKHDPEVYPQNFLIDMVKRLIEAGPRKPYLTDKRYQKVEMCPSFHVHEEGAKCTKKRTKRSSDEMSN